MRISIKRFLVCIVVLVSFARSLDAPAPLPSCAQECPAWLQNCGNTCWMNAALQCLFNMGDLNDVVKTIKYPPDSLAAEYVKLFNTYNRHVILKLKLLENDLRVFIQKITMVPGLTKGLHNDAQEGMFAIINSLIASDTPSDQEKIKSLLVIDMEKYKTFENVAIGDKNHSKELFLALDVNDGDTVEKALKQNFSPTEIEDYEMPDKRRKTIKVSTKIKHLSKYLIIQLKCFGFDYGTMSQFKINIAQKPETSLDMSGFVDEVSDETFSIHYELQGVIAHGGASTGGGHYIAFVHRDNQWYLCDDLRIQIEKMKEPFMLGYEPYVLIYCVAKDDKSSLDVTKNLTDLAESLRMLAKKVSA